MANGWRSVLWPEDKVRRFLHVLLAFYIIKQILIAFIMPAFSGHDEVAHFQYVRTVAIRSTKRSCVRPTRSTLMTSGTKPTKATWFE